METGDAAPQPIYNSLFTHGVDEKRRIQIPAKWRPNRDGFEFTLVAWRKESEGPCIRVLPPQEMQAVIRQITQTPSVDPHKGRLRRLIGSDSAQVSVDKAGRICLPEAIAKAAGITTEGVLIGLLNYFEIWSPERYERVQALDAMMAQEAFKLMD